ncbi:hypothetical protein Fmac_022577 [Flemingia macrophylla]|uniref:Uncharacterized protein n=1 Tax=Flemingia macrophylla TaxID=520843 RepID=A0ABD1M1V9_9FABA
MSSLASSASSFYLIGIYSDYHILEECRKLHVKQVVSYSRDTIKFGLFTLLRGHLKNAIYLVLHEGCKIRYLHHFWLDAV